MMGAGKANNELGSGAVRVAGTAAGTGSRAAVGTAVGTAVSTAVGTAVRSSAVAGASTNVEGGAVASVGSGHGLGAGGTAVRDAKGKRASNPGGQSHSPSGRAGLLTELILIVIALLFLYPIIHLLLSSIKRPEDLYNPLSYPTTFYWGHYVKAFEKVDVWLGLGNTVLICCAALALTIVVSSMAGYMIARQKRRGFQLLFLFLLSGMIIPIQTSMYPIFKLGVDLHLMDTRTFLVLLYTAGTIPFATFLYTGFTRAIPWELEESSTIDGCGSFRTFWSIIFPLLLPATGTVIIINVFSFWNDLFTPLLYLKDPGKMTLMPQIVQFKANNQSIDYGPIFALCSVATLPLMLVFIVLQKQMLKGMIAGSVKG